MRRVSWKGRQAALATPAPTAAALCQATAAPGVDKTQFVQNVTDGLVAIKAVTDGLPAVSETRAPCSAPAGCWLVWREVPGGQRPQGLPLLSRRQPHAAFLATPAQCCGWSRRRRREALCRYTTASRSTCECAQKCNSMPPRRPGGSISHWGTFWRLFKGCHGRPAPCCASLPAATATAAAATPERARRPATLISLPARARWVHGKLFAALDLLRGRPQGCPRHALHGASSSPAGNLGSPTAADFPAAHLLQLLRAKPERARPLGGEPLGANAVGWLAGWARQPAAPPSLCLHACRHGRWPVCWALCWR